MTIADWLAFSVTDAERRNLVALTPILEGLARATTILREAEWNADARGLPTRDAETDVR